MMQEADLSYNAYKQKTRLAPKPFLWTFFEIVHITRVNPNYRYRRRRSTELSK